MIAEIGSELSCLISFVIGDENVKLTVELRILAAKGQ